VAWRGVTDGSWKLNERKQKKIFSSLFSQPEITESIFGLGQGDPDPDPGPPPLIP